MPGTHRETTEALTPLRSAGIAVAVVAGIALIAWIDYRTDTELRLAALYYAPIGLAAWYFGRGGGTAAALLATTGWVVSNLPGEVQSSHAWIWLANTAMQVASFALIGLLIAVQRDAVRRERNLAGIDVLTALMNRRAFFDTGERILERCRRTESPATVAYVDLDDFKLVNDKAGHAAGDAVLREVADAIRLAVRPTDLTARFGGDEFVILLPELTDQDAAVALERVRSSLTAALGGRPYRVTASIGAVAFQVPPEDLAAMVQRADEAMYAAKKGGRNKVRIETVRLLES